jgi:hypothetical protein
MRFYFAREPNQFADLANLFFERQLREFAAHLGFHVREFFGESSRMNDQETIIIADFGMRIADSFSAINFSSMSDPVNSHNFCRIGNLVDHAIMTDPNPPVVLRSSKFATASRPRLVCETTQRISYAESHIERESSEVLPSRTLDDDTIHRLALWQIGKHLL